MSIRKTHMVANYLAKNSGLKNLNKGLCMIAFILSILLSIPTGIQTASLLYKQDTSCCYHHEEITSGFLDFCSIAGLGRRDHCTNPNQFLTTDEATKPTKEEKKEILRYLFKYGYIDYVKKGHKDGIFSSADEVNEEHLLQDAISVFLKMHDVKSDKAGPVQYGSDGKTSVKLSDIIEYSRLPRCSNPDLPKNKIVLMNSKVYKDNEPLGYSGSRVSDYLTGSRYSNHNQTWRLMGTTSSAMDYDQVRETLNRAFLTWSKYAPLNFVELTSDQQGPVHHEIYFVEGKHVINSWWRTPCCIDIEPDSIDTAHGYFPNFGGTLHINRNRRWAHRYTGKTNELNLWQTATHEIGHTLGLEHIPARLTRKNGVSLEVSKQVMHPNYHEIIEDGSLGDYDALVIQTLYGKYSTRKKYRYSQNNDDDDDLDYIILPTPEEHSTTISNRKYALSLKPKLKADQDEPSKFTYDIPVDLGNWLDALDIVDIK